MRNTLRTLLIASAWTFGLLALVIVLHAQGVQITTKATSATGHAPQAERIYFVGVREPRMDSVGKFMCAVKEHEISVTLRRIAKMKNMTTVFHPFYLGAIALEIELPAGTPDAIVTQCVSTIQSDSDTQVYFTEWTKALPSGVPAGESYLWRILVGGTVKQFSPVAVTNKK